MLCGLMLATTPHTRGLTPARVKFLLLLSIILTFYSLVFIVICDLFSLTDFLATAEYRDPPNFCRRRKSAGKITAAVINAAMFVQEALLSQRGRAMLRVYIASIQNVERSLLLSVFSASE